MRNKLPAIIGLILVLALSALVFGCDTTAKDADGGSQADAIEQDGADVDADETEQEEEEAEPVVEEADYTPGDGPRVVMETSQGRIVIELFPDVAPQHVDNFKKLIGQKFYDGLTFHRYEPGFVIQGGDPSGNGTGGPGWTVPGEFGGKHIRGALAMARSQDPDSAGSQFYFVLDRATAASLDGQYTVFGQVLEGMDAVDKLRQGDIMNSVAMQPEG